MMSFFLQFCKFFLVFVFGELSLRGSLRGSFVISRRNSLRDVIFQILVKKNFGFLVIGRKKFVLLFRSRLCEFMDVVKKFEGGKFLEKFLKIVDEERKVMGDYLV